MLAANDKGFMLLYALMKIACGISDIIRIARITFKVVNNALVIDQSRFLFFYLKLIPDLTSCEDWL